MSNKALIAMLLSASAGLFFIVDVNADISGCYLINEKIPELSTGKDLPATSWMKIEQQKDNFYLVRGELTGANHHVCTVTSNKGSIIMKRKKNTLNYHTEIDYYDGKRTCDLKFDFLKDKFVITENNYNCSDIVFACGERIKLHKYEFPLTSKTDTKKCDALIK